MTTDVQPMPARTTQTYSASGGGVTALEMADLGMRAGSLGMERGQVAQLTRRLETAAHEAAMANVDALLDEVSALIGARLNRLLQDVRAIAEYAPPPQAPAHRSGLDLLLDRNPAPRPTPVPAGLISRDVVLQLVTAAMMERPNR